jgi:hypothetical protein
VFLPGLLLAAHLVARAQTCDIVDNGSPVDGVTTVTILSPEAACTDITLLGWRCTTLRSQANDNGAVYDVLVAWNLPAQTVRGTFVWVSGEGGLRMLRMNPFAKQAQDDLATNHGIRTIETQFLDVAGYHVFPSNGPVNISAVYTDLVEYFVTQGIMAGVHGHVGSSGGSQLAADSLAYHDGALLLQGVVLSGGPIFVDLEPECTQPSSALYGNLHQRDQVDQYNYRDLGSNPCAANDPNPTPAYTCRSTLGLYAESHFPNEAIDLVIGTDESNWITSTSAFYRDSITALEVTYDQPVAPHTVFETQAGADAVESRVLSIVDRYESGAGAVPDGAFVPGTQLRVDPSGSNIQLTWGAACGAAEDYEVYEGQLGVPGSLTQRLCSTSGATSAVISPSAGNRYYLVVPLHAGHEGSYGKKSDGVERAAAASACAPQLLAGCSGDVYQRAGSGTP